MKIVASNYGTLCIADKEVLFKKLLELLRGVCYTTAEHPACIGLSGGSTPKAFYRWCVEGQKLSSALMSKVLWAVSDERCVPLAHSASNFGVADRLLLQPLGVPASAKLPWLVDGLPPSAAAGFNLSWRKRFGPTAGFNLCLLGMGDDGHTASLFPGSPLLSVHLQEGFAAVGVPGKGWRLTVTPAGLSRCSQIVVNVQGGGKATALKEVIQGPFKPVNLPIQVLRECADRVVWLVDTEAAVGLEDV